MAKKTKKKSTTPTPLQEKTYACKLSRKPSATYEAVRADSAALMHVEAVTAPSRVGRGRVYDVHVTGPTGKESMIQVRETVERKLATVKGT